MVGRVLLIRNNFVWPDADRDVESGAEGEEGPT